MHSDPPDTARAAPPPADGQPAVDFSDLHAQLASMGLAGGPDPITPAEAAEAMDDAEASDADDADDADELQPGARPTWAELYAADEAERRADMDILSITSEIFAAHVLPIPGDEGSGAEWKLKGMESLPRAAKIEFGRFLAELARTATKKAAKLGGDE